MSLKRDFFLLSCRDYGNSVWSRNCLCPWWDDLDLYIVIEFMDKTQLTMNFYWSIYYLFWCVLTRRNYKTLRVSNLVDKYCREKGWCVFYIKNIHCVQRQFYLYRKINLNILFLFVKKIKCYILLQNSSVP